MWPFKKKPKPVAKDVQSIWYYNKLPRQVGMPFPEEFVDSVTTQVRDHVSTMVWASFFIKD